MPMPSKISLSIALALRGGYAPSGGGFMGYSFDTYPTLLSADFVQYTQLPDAQNANVSGGFTCTGLFKLANGNWLVGNDGRSTESSTDQQASLVILSNDFTTVATELTMYDADNLTLAGTGSIQGVCQANDGTYWFAAKGREKAVNVDQSGNLIQEISKTECNALGYDSVNNYLIAGSEASNIVIFDLADNSALYTIDVGAALDQIYYDSEFNILYGTYGNNGTTGTVRVYDISIGSTSGTATLINTLSMENAQAIEGVSVDLSELKMYISNDGAFHTAASPAISMGIEYDIIIEDGASAVDEETTTEVVDGVAYWNPNSVSYIELTNGLIIGAGGSITMYATLPISAFSTDSYLCDGETDRPVVNLNHEGELGIVSGLTLSIDDVALSSGDSYLRDGEIHELTIDFSSAKEVTRLLAKYTGELMFSGTVYNIILSGITGESYTTLTIPLTEAYDGTGNVYDSNGNTVGTKVGDIEANYTAI